MLITAQGDLQFLTHTQKTVKLKLKLFLSTPRRRIGKWRYNVTHPLPLHYMQVSGQLHSSAALPSWKGSPLHAEWERGWAPKTAWMPLPGIEKRVAQPVAASLTPSELARLHRQSSHSNETANKGVT